VPVVFLAGIGTRASTLPGAAVGAAPIYVVDLADGQAIAKIVLPWRDTVTAGISHGVRGRPLAVDTDQDLLVDRLYVGDMEGRLWRIDLSSSDPVAWESPGAAKVIWDPVSPYTRLPITFPPTATYTGDGDILLYFGSGDPSTSVYGSSPGYFYVLKDGRSITASSAKLFSSFQPIRFQTGEGLAGEPVLANGTIFFTTYYVSSTEVCTGSARLWALDYQTGLAGPKKLDSDGDGTPDANYIELGAGIPGSVVVGYDRWYVSVNDGSVGGTSGAIGSSGIASGKYDTVEPLMPYSWVEVTGR
jgi:Tfp pilus tip-associated adhesin PilY1